MQVAVHRHGCCVLQRCLDAAGPDLRIKLVDEVGAAYRFVRVCFLDVSVFLFSRMLCARRLLLLAQEAARGWCLLCSGGSLVARSAGRGALGSVLVSVCTRAS